MFMMHKCVVALALLATVQGVFADTCTVKMRDGEKWWGLCNSFGREMPFTEKTSFSCDLRLNN